MNTERIRESLSKLQRRIQALRPRERLALFVVGVLIIVALWDGGLLQRLELRHEVASASLAEFDGAATGGELGSPDIAAVGALTQRLEQLTSAEQAARLQLQQRAAAYVEPQQMLSLVRDLLQARAGLRLTRLATLEPEQLDAPQGSLVDSAAGTELSDQAEDSATASDPGDAPASVRAPAVAYLHGMELNVEGNFQDIYAYLRALESQRWHLMWRGLELEVVDYPLLRARLTLATVSIDRHWVGI